MKKTKATLVGQLIFCFILIQACLHHAWVVPADAAYEHGAELSLTLQGNYDDNVQFSGDEDYILVVSPRLALSGVTEITELQVAADLDIREYEENGDLSSVDQYYQILGGVTLEERVSLDIIGTYERDQTFQKELEETGIVIDQTSRVKAAVNPIGTFWLAPRDRLQLTYEYGDTSFNADERRDYTYHDARIGWLHDLKNERTTFGLLVRANRTEYGDNIDNPGEDVTVETVGAGLQLDHLISERFILNLKAGARYTESKSKGPGDDDTTSDTNFVGEASVRWLFEKTTISARVNHQLVPSSAGDSVNRTLGNLGYGYRFTEKMRWNLGGSYRRSDPLGSGQTVQTFGGRTSLAYSFTRYLDLRLGYSYSETDQDTSSIADDERNRVFLELRWIIHRPEWRVREPKPLVKWPHRL